MGGSSSSRGGSGSMGGNTVLLTKKGLYQKILHLSKKI